MLVKYECEICNKTFETKIGAITCEDTHQIINCISNASYLPNKKYPYKFIANFEDGNTYEYRIVPTQTLHMDLEDE